MTSSSTPPGRPTLLRRARARTLGIAAAALAGTGGLTAVVDATQASATTTPTPAAETTSGTSSTPPGSTGSSGSSGSTRSWGAGVGAAPSRPQGQAQAPAQGGSHSS